MLFASFSLVRSAASIAKQEPHLIFPKCFDQNILLHTTNTFCNVIHIGRRSDAHHYRMRAIWMGVLMSADFAFRRKNQFERRPIKITYCTFVCVCVCARATSNMTLWVANNRRSTEKEMWAKLWQKIRIYDEYKLHFFSSIIFEIHTGTGSRANTWYARAKQTQSWTVGKREKRQRQRARKQNYPHINGGAYIFRAHTKLASSEQQQKWRCHRPSNDVSFNIFLSSPILF